MLETEFIRSLQSNYERVHLPDRPDEQRYQYCILTRGGIRGLLACSLRYINGEAYLYYDITSRQNVAQLYGKQTIDRTWFGDFMWSYEQVCQELGRFLLDEKNILVYPEQIFVDLGNHNFYFLYLPYNEEGNGFGKFLEFVLEHMDYEDLEFVERVYFMYEQFEKYGEVYLQNQVFEDARSLDVRSGNDVLTDSVLKIAEDDIDEGELVREKEVVATAMPAVDSKEKKGFFGRWGLKKKRTVEQKNEYHESVLVAKDGRAVAEETDYLEEDYGRTIYIEQESEGSGIRKLYTPDGRIVARLEKDVFTIGKQAEADLVLEDDTISRLHARICKEEKLVYLEDLNSTNGTFKNGLRLQPYEKRRLEEGDEVRLGKLLFVYR